MKRVLITTTIHVPESLSRWRDWALDDDDVVIVVGDLKTPHNDVRELLSSLPGENVYLAPDDQLNSLTGKETPWNCIQRRNIALLEAIKRDPEYIITMDDDNHVMDPSFGVELDHAFTGDDVTMVSSSTEWYNVGAMLTPKVVVRGFPIAERHVRPYLTSDDTSSIANIGVVASLWLGEPDIDAVERIVRAPIITNMVAPRNVVLESGTWCPFNTQATAFRTQFAPFMMVWPHTGRYDDIWASFLTQRAMEISDYHVSFGRPLVHQDRNPHDLIRDLSDELFGMKHNLELINAVRGLPDVGNVSSVADAVATLDTWYDLLIRIPFITNETCKTFDAWYNDLTEVVGSVK